MRPSSPAHFSWNPKNGCPPGAISQDCVWSDEGILTLKKNWCTFNYHQSGDSSKLSIFPLWCKHPSLVLGVLPVGLGAQRACMQTNVRVSLLLLPLSLTPVSHPFCQCLWNSKSHAFMFSVDIWYCFPNSPPKNRCVFKMNQRNHLVELSFLFWLQVILSLSFPVTRMCYVIRGK